MAGLDGRTALVAGGGGIGRAICMRLAHDGADIAINYARDATAPFGFVCTSADIADEPAHLMSEHARHIAKQRIYVNGGGFPAP
jgi:shikimate 5-dehydrogenase